MVKISGNILKCIVLKSLILVSDSLSCFSVWKAGCKGHRLPRHGQRSRCSRWALFRCLAHCAAEIWIFLLPFCCGTGQKALADAGINYSAVQQACVGYVYGMYIDITSTRHVNSYTLTYVFSDDFSVFLQETRHVARGLFITVWVCQGSQ